MADNPAKNAESSADVAPEELARRRANARRTALILAATAGAIFVTFLITGITGRG